MGNFRIFLNSYIDPLQPFLQIAYSVILRIYSVIYSVKLRIYNVIFLILQNSTVEVVDVVAKHYILSNGGIVILTAIN